MTKNGISFKHTNLSIHSSCIEIWVHNLQSHYKNTVYLVVMLHRRLKEKLEETFIFAFHYRIINLIKANPVNIVYKNGKVCTKWETQYHNPETTLLLYSQWLYTKLSLVIWSLNYQMDAFRQVSSSLLQTQNLTFRFQSDRREAVCSTNIYIYLHS